MAAWKGKVENVFVSSDATNTTIKTITIEEGSSYLWAEIVNSADKALDAFAIQVQPHADADFHTIASVASDFTTAMKRPLLACDQDMTSLALSTAGLLWMEVKGLNAVKFLGSSAAGSDTAISVYWSVR